MTDLPAHTIDVRTQPVATDVQYERAIKRAEATFRKNKSRMWVLKILREYIREEVSALKRRTEAAPGYHVEQRSDGQWAVFEGGGYRAYWATAEQAYRDTWALYNEDLI